MVTENPDSGDDRFVRLTKSRDQAQIWHNRAAMAWQQCNLALVEQALKRMWQYQVAAANIEGREPPEGPPDALEYFKNRGPDDEPPWRPFDPSRVPLSPAPSPGDGEVAFPLPEPDEREK